MGTSDCNTDGRIRVDIVIFLPLRASEYQQWLVYKSMNACDWLDVGATTVVFIGTEKEIGKSLHEIPWQVNDD